MVKWTGHERVPQRVGVWHGDHAGNVVSENVLLENTYKSRRRELEAAIGTLFLAGVSVRTLRAVTGELFDRQGSTATNFDSTCYLGEEFEQFQTESVPDDFSFLLLDGIAQRANGNGVKKKVMLCALGLREDGTKEILSFRLADQEDTNEWRAFLVDIKNRGLQGKSLKLITADDNPSLLQAITEAYPFTKVQQCIVRKLRNLSVTLKRVHVRRCMAEAKEIFNAPSRSESNRRFQAWKEKWQAKEEKAVQCLANDFHACLYYYSFPEQLWTRIRSTNLLEREFRHVRRLAWPMAFLPREESADRIQDKGTNGVLQNSYTAKPAISAEVLV